MKTFLHGMDRPVVLEVEMPLIKGDITHRRIGFYRRQGFSLRRIPYKQPPYREGDKWLPMTELVCETIYREVYGV